MVNTWETEVDEQTKLVNLYSQIGAHITLDDSGKEEVWGIAKYLEPGQFSLKAVEGEPVGYWTISPTDGLIHVFLKTPLHTLVDKAVQQFIKYAEIRKTEVTAPKSTKARTPRSPAAPPEPSEDELVISNMRKLFGK